MNGRHILLAEDDPRDAQMTLAALEEQSEANEVFVVHDGEEVLDYLYCREKFEAREGGNPIAVLLDLKMPKIDGLEALKIIKADEHLKTIPVVMLTSSRETADLQCRAANYRKEVKSEIHHQYSPSGRRSLRCRARPGDS
jgi:CheY-like chemotaxis protein